jgi:act minimal PKS acyl carrier protein
MTAIDPTKGPEVSKLELSDLIEILRDCAGQEDGVDLDGDVLDTPFTDLGYDSIALLETAGRVQQRCGVVISDDALPDADTPRRFLDLVNETPAVSA